MIRRLFFASIVWGALLGMAVAEESVSDSTGVFETRHYTALELPQKMWNALVYPIGEFTIYAEHSELPQRVRNWFTNEDRTFGLFPYGQLGGETGTGIGFNTFHTNLFGREKEFSASYIFAASERQMGQALYCDPNVGGGDFYWSAQADFLKTDNEDATVNGIYEGSEDALVAAGLAEEDYLHEIQRFDGMVTVGWRPHAHELEDYRQNVYLEGRLGFGRQELEGGRGAESSFLVPGQSGRASLVPGLREEISYASIGGRVAYDDRDYREPARELSHPLNYQFPGRVLLLADDRYYSFRDIAYAERGGLLQAELDLITGSADVSFLRIGVEAQRFFTLFWRNRIMALRARLDKAHRLGDEGIVPYAEMPTLGGGLRLRGSPRGRWRGEGALLLSAEYRYPIWDSWNAYLFWDEGQVFDEFDQVEAGEFRSSFGAGITLRTEKAFLIGLRVGHSEEEKALVGFSLEQEF